MSRKLLIGLVIAAVIAVIFGGTCIGQYNSLVNSEESVDESWAQVENVLQRRADLIPNLVATVKGYAAHEKEIFTEVANARSRLLTARGPEEAAAANESLTGALGRLLVIAEAYPQLRASENFQRLQDELAGTENRIAVERRRYNESVRSYNQRIRSFPTRVIAGMFGFDAKQYFQAEAGAQSVPHVDFGG
jgi:LemA protein